MNKAAKITYWITTGLLAAFILSGAFFMNDPKAQTSLTTLKVPHWLALEAGYGQPVAALILILPFIGKRIKEWAYVALGIVYLSACYAHTFVEGFNQNSGIALILFVVLLISYICYHKMQPTKRY